MHGGRSFRPLPLVLIGLLTTLLAGGGALAATSTGASKGVIHAYEAFNKGPGAPRTIVITGAINDAGVDNANGKLALAKGTIKDVPSATFTKRLQDLYGRTLNPPGCSLVGTITGPVKIVGGTKAYAGIKGTVNVTYTVAAVLPKLKTGKCDTRQHTRPIGVAVFLKASGSVSLK